MHGFGPNPASVLRWRQFWYAWAHIYLKDSRTYLRSRHDLLYAAVLPHSKKADEFLARLEAQQRASDTQLRKILRRYLPRSVARLINAPQPIARTMGEWYDMWIAEQRTPGRKAFVEAAKRAYMRRKRSGRQLDRQVIIGGVAVSPHAATVN
jgi:hypothetical protein